ncbi:MAG TPA: hypothetical protein VMY05_11645 [Acidobacteriota bacterium]|nr:hypothetical protein [Acidobacteriota bacterium]
MINGLRLAALPGYARLFVALFTALVLCVVLSAVWLFMADEGREGWNCYRADTTEVDEAEIADDIDEIESDSASVRAPIWDTEHAGEDQPFDSSELQAVLEYATLPEADESDEGGENAVMDDVRLAHARAGRLTLLFFGVGLVYLFSSAGAGTKKVVYWVFGLSIPVYAAGLSARQVHWIFDAALAVSGAAILLVILYMAVRIFRDLASKGAM